MVIAIFIRSSVLSITALCAVIPDSRALTAVSKAISKIYKATRLCHPGVWYRGAGVFSDSVDSWDMVITVSS